MISKLRKHYGKVIVAILWAVVLCFAYAWLENSGIPLRQLPHVLKRVVWSYGYYGPLLLFGLYIARTFLFIPTTPLVLVAGSLYGPFGGLFLTLIGENISASMGFAMGRFFGRHYVREHEQGWVKKYDELLATDGFMAVLMMRLLFFPFDVLNISCGMSSMTYRQYVVATFLGLFPVVLTLTILGDAFVNPKKFMLFAVLFVLTVVGAYCLTRSKWVRHKLFAKQKELF